ncbi:MAG: sulfatase [Verrucomicrobiaceae bacterium]|nr:sulfatase [Verrucomicrobiaceae bacterium]
MTRPFLAALCLMWAGSSFANESRPNILFFFADDQRYDTLSCAGHPVVQTPNIDALAEKGVRFSNAHVTTAVCWVSRAVVFTGQWARSHVQRNAVPKVKPDAVTTLYPLQLRKAGYRTGHFGKWHFMGPADFKPEEQFDAFEQIGRNPYIKTLPDGTKRHETDIVCDRGISFLKEQSKDKPFCLQLSFNAAHAEDGDKRPGIGHYPWPSSTDGMYEDRSIPPPRLGASNIFEAHPQFLKDSINRERFFWGYDTPEKYETNVRAYYRMISGIDKGIARVLAVLEQTGLADNTIVVYSADNGYYLGDRGFQGKWSHYEESLRVPMVIYDPRLSKERRGKVLDELVLNVDLPATFLDWAKAERPASYQGRSIATLLDGSGGDKPWRSHFFCEHLDLAPTLTWEGIRDSRYVYARYFDQQPAYEFLHDLQKDPDELTNVASDPAHAAALTKMRELCDAEMSARGGAMPPLEQRGPGKQGKGRGKKK